MVRIHYLPPPADHRQNVMDGVQYGTVMGSLFGSMIALVGGAMSGIFFLFMLGLVGGLLSWCAWERYYNMATSVRYDYSLPRRTR